MQALPLTLIPDDLRAEVARHWERFSQTSPALAAADLTASRLAELTQVWAGSAAVAQRCAQQPEMLLDWLRSGALDGVDAAGACRARLQARLAEVADEAELSRALRAFRHAEMVRIVWRDLAGKASLAETLNDLSELAEVCVDEALTRLDGWLRDDWGAPCDAAGAAQFLSVLGMGKLGGRELNVSSDIDLIFVYGVDGEVQGRRAKSNAEYFLRLGRQLIRVLDERTADGWVFRVDMRLRPWGESGPLVASLEAVAHYYEAVGREWERYAMIKARPIAGDRATGERLMQILRPFVYRKYLDFGVFDALREMKSAIEQEMARRGMQDDIKLGPGGIREVEFIGQAFQLIRGGREKALQVHGIVEALTLLAARGDLPQRAVDALIRGYAVLRRVENRLQAAADRQTHCLPEDAVARARLAHAMGRRDWAALLRDLDDVRRDVHQTFNRILAAPPAADGDSGDADTALLAWRHAEARQAAFDDGEALDEANRRLGEGLTQLGFQDGHEALQGVLGFAGGAVARSLSEQGRARLSKVLPPLIRAAAEQSNPDETLRRLLHWVQTIARRSVYLSLLNEHPAALKQLVRLVSASSWLADYLGRHPVLLDELLDPRRLGEPLARDALAAALRQRLAQCAPADTEERMETLRQFKQAQAFHAAVAEVLGRWPLMRVSDALTAVAEVSLEAGCELAWRDIAERYGEPTFRQRGETRQAAMGIIAYGKLGGLELGHGSDLDLVFLHNSRGADQYTRGDRAVDNATFFARVGQRLMHYINTPTASGKLYEVDLRLRPSGNSGLLVASMAAFEAYQHEKAWTWEHQALVRARFICGDADIATRFAAIRRAVLSQPRDLDQLRRDVVAMRQRMREQFGSKSAELFHLKHDAGGIVDIEFMVQYGVLAWSAQHPELTVWSDNVRLLADFARSGLMPSEAAELLTQAYLAYRACSHRLALQGEPSQAPAAQWRHYQTAVQALWRQYLEPVAPQATSRPGVGRD